jgi:hypothetical protein
MRSNYSRRRVYGIALGVVMLCIVAYRLGSGSASVNIEPPPPAPSVPKEDAWSDPRTFFAAAAPAQPAERVDQGALLPPPLPPAGVPLALQLPTLIERAANGDGAASCRLAVGTSRCAEYLQSKSFVDQRLSRLDSVAGSRSESVWVESLARMQEELAVSEPFCAGFTADIALDVDGYLSSASLTPQQKTVLATRLSGGQTRRLQPNFGASRAPDYLLPQFISENMVDFLKAGYAARQPLALENLILLHAPSTWIDTQGPMVRLPDQQRFLAYAELYRRLFGAAALGPQVGRIMDAVAKSVPPTTLQRLDAEVELEAQRWARALGSPGLPAGQTLPIPADVTDPIAACGD